MSINDVPEVAIDQSGRFKYILIKLTQGGESKYVVRGTIRGEYHADILDEFQSTIKAIQCEVECVGGGRILFEPAKKDIFVYGYSMVISVSEGSV